MADTVVDLRGDGGCSPLEPAAKKHRSGAKDDVKKARAKYDALAARDKELAERARARGVAKGDGDVINL